MLVDTVAFPAYTRRAIELAGPFDEELVRNQDDEYNYRLRALGCKVLLAPEVSSRYYSRSSLRSLWRQYFQYGFWKVRVMQKHPRQMSLRQFVPPLFITLLLIPVLATLFVPPALLLSIAVLCAYVVANVLASLLTARGKAKEHLIALPVVFAVLHFSYGLGFLVGLVRFWNCWRFENPAQGNIRSFASNEEGNTAKRGQPETEVSR